MKQNVYEPKGTNKMRCVLLRLTLHAAGYVCDTAVFSGIKRSVEQGVRIYIEAEICQFENVLLDELHSVRNCTLEPLQHIDIKS
jgi:hypothetical protein